MTSSCRRWSVKRQFQDVVVAAAKEARQIQGHFLALTHNLLILFRGFLESDFGLRDQKLEAKRQHHLEQREKAAQAQGYQLHPLHRKMPTIVQLSLQFIRTLRNQILAKASFHKALAQIRAMLLAYL